MRLTLYAGHETTSGVLSFVVHCLLTNPDAYVKLQAEIDAVIGDRTVTLADIAKMPYMTGPCATLPPPPRRSHAHTAVVRETMRLHPPVSARGVSAIEDTTLCGGKYAVKKGAFFRLQTICAQRDPAVWGEDVRQLCASRRGAC
jgi:cytochrome P450/NADPH-cytochrome P450 reductase